MQRWMAKVCIDGQDSRPCLGNDDAKIEQRRCLAFIGPRTRHEDRLYRLVEIAEGNVCPQIAIGFGKLRVERFLRQQELASLGHPPPPVLRSTCALAFGMMPITGAPIISSTASASSNDCRLKC